MKRHRLLSALVLTALAAPGCAPLYPTPPPIPPLPIAGAPLARLSRVDGAVFRSAQPSAQQLKELVQSYRIRSIVKLNFGREPAPPGLPVFYHPMNPYREPAPEEIAAILADVERAPKPVLIHCTHGEDRTGLIVALYRIRHGSSLESAFTDMMRRGFHPYRGLWRAWLRASGWLGEPQALVSGSPERSLSNLQH